MLLRCLFVAGLLGFAPAALAQTPALEAAQTAADPFGPAVGSAAPAFEVVDASGAPRRVADLSGENGVVVYFNRSLDWCPICLRQTLEVDAARDAFAERGYGLAVLTHDSAETLARAAERREIALTLLSDEGSQTIDAFDIRDPVYADPSHRAHGVPYPITFVLSPEGEVKAKFWHEAGLGDQRGYAVRVSVEDVLAGLDAL